MKNILFAASFFTACLGTVSATVTPLSGVVSLSTGVDFSCAVRADGAVFCWGLNDAGQLGTPTSLVNSGGGFKTDAGINATRIATISNGTQVTSGRGHSCLLRRDGTVWCWGNNSRGQLGDGTAVLRKAPVKVNGLPTVVAVFAGATSSCALTAAGRLWCWGDFEYFSGLLFGDLAGDHAFNAREFAMLSNVRTVAMAADHACAVVSAGDVFCCGATTDKVRLVTAKRNSSRTRRKRCR